MEKLPIDMKVLQIFLICFSFIQSTKAIEGRIIGGQNANKYEFPWNIRIVNPLVATTRCGGVILNTEWILTAARCVATIGSGRSHDVVAGLQDLNDAERTKQTRGISEIHIHPEYTRTNYSSNDFALIRVGRPFNFNKAVNNALLPTENSPVANGSVTLTGWGRINTAGDSPTVLQKVDLQIVSREYCSMLYERTTTITPEMICAADNMKSPCTGDVGAPLVQRGNGAASCKKDVVYGIVSFGGGECGKGGMPTVFGNVKSAIDWIDFQISKSGTVCGNNSTSISKCNAGIPSLLLAFLLLAFFKIIRVYSIIHA